MWRRMMLALLFAGAFAPHVLIGTAEARPATCFTDDEGRYRCDFRQFGGDGSFVVTAEGRPAYTVSLFERGAADGFADYGNGNIALPRPFYRSDQDRACWVSDATGFSICVY